MAHRRQQSGVGDTTEQAALRALGRGASVSSELQSPPQQVISTGSSVAGQPTTGGNRRAGGAPQHHSRLSQAESTGEEMPHRHCRKTMKKEKVHVMGSNVRFLEHVRRLVCERRQSLRKGSADINNIKSL